MEILTTNVSYVGSVIFGVFMIGAILYGCITCFDEKFGVEKILGGIIVAVGVIGILSIFTDPATVTYDAIVTDWNEVYSQGYEVVETNDKIVTLRKVGD